MKIKNTGKDMTLRGVDFPKGKAVQVDDPALAQKCLAMPNFEEVVRKNGKDKD